MFYQLPPAGNRIKAFCQNDAEYLPERLFHPYTARYFASGTAALAAAITASMRIKNVASAEVIMPAYGCPDLASAAIYSGAKPVLVDLMPDRPWMDLTKLSKAVTGNTVAIIAAGLFGISERLTLIRSLSEQRDIVLIEDSAQAFPSNQEPDFWLGDMVILSFGRGKPVSLLGGGGVLFRDEKYGELLPAGTSKIVSDRYKHALFQLKVHLYNMLILPRLFWLPQKMPFLKLGETRYHPLSGIDPMDPVRLAAMPCNLDAYRESDGGVQKDISDMVAELSSTTASVIDLPVKCNVPHGRRLLRYPLLVDARIRERLYSRLQFFGSGSSVMYPAAMPGIPGLETILYDQGPFPAAEAFASRILTLPTHGGVGSKDIIKIRSALSMV